MRPRTRPHRLMEARRGSSSSVKSSVQEARDPMEEARERLQKLKDLHEQGLIDKDDFKEPRLDMNRNPR